MGFHRNLVQPLTLVAFLAVFAIIPKISLQDQEVLNGQEKSAHKLQNEAALRSVDKIRKLKDSQKRQLDSLGGGYLGQQKRQLDSLGGGYLGQLDSLGGGYLGQQKRQLDSL